jgi:hypothetical protein
MLARDRLCRKSQKSNRANNIAKVDFLTPPKLQGRSREIEKSVIVFYKMMRSRTSRQPTRISSLSKIWLRCANDFFNTMGRERTSCMHGLPASESRFRPATDILASHAPGAPSSGTAMIILWHATLKFQINHFKMNAAYDWDIDFNTDINCCAIFSVHFSAKARTKFIGQVS